MQQSRTFKGGTDERTGRTREWIMQSFNGLVLDRPYEEIHVADIIDKAGVGRSTFYEHFRNKDEVLRQSITAILSILADAVGDRANVQAVRHVLEHFRDNRAVARVMLTGAAGAPITRRLAELIEIRLGAITPALAGEPMIPSSMTAMQMAQAQLSLISAWLDSGVEPCTSAALAAAICRTTHALAVAVTPPSLQPPSRH